MPFNSGAMIALVVPDPENYAITPPTENSLGASDLHITVAYLGEASEISAPEREAILEACQVLADTSDAPESLFPASTGVFPPDPESPEAEENPKAAYYAAPAHPERFSSLREDLITHLSARGVSHHISTKHPVFTPHVTLTYESMETPPNLNLPTPVPVQFSELIVSFGEETHSFTLRTEASGPELPLTASVRSKIAGLAAHAHRSTEYVTAMYMRQTHVTASAAQTRAQSALDATAKTLNLEELTTPFSRIQSLLDRASMSTSPEVKVYYASRALALASKTNPSDTNQARNLSAMTASIQSIIADGNSRAARAARARAQLRDRYGRWIFMGGSIRFKISMAGTPGGGRWEHGVARGVNMSTGHVQVELEDGSLVSVPANKVEQTKATLGEKIAGKYRSFRPRSEGKAGDATTVEERAKAERTENVDAADNEAFPAIERLMSSTADVAAGGNPKGNHVITLMSNNADEIKRASLAGEDTVEVTGSRAPFRGATTSVPTADAMAVINDLDSRRVLPEDYDNLDDTEKARAYGAAQGRAIAGLSGRFNDRDDAEATELRRAPSMRSEDIREITEDDITEAEPQDFIPGELADLVNEATTKLNEKVDGSGPLVSARDQIGSAVAQANGRFRTNEISKEEYLNALDAIKEFAYAQGGAGNSDSDAFDAFSEDIDNIHAAAGGSDDIDRVKAMFNSIESDSQFVENLDAEFGSVSEFNDHMSAIREKVGLGAYLRDPAALAGDLEEFKEHFNSDSKGVPVSRLINPETSGKVAEDLDESIAALRGERTDAPHDSSAEEDPGLGDVVDTDTDTDADFPEYVASTEEVQESINEASALYDVLWEAFPDGFLQDDAPGSEDFFDAMNEFFSPDFEETPENFRQMRDKMDAFDSEVMGALTPDQRAAFNEQKDKFVASLDKASDSLPSAEEAPSTDESPVDVPEFAEDAAKVSTDLKDILEGEDYSPSRGLRDAVNDISNIVANVGLDIDSGSITPNEGADILDAAREDFMNLYGDEELGDELNAAGIGEDIEEFLNEDYADFAGAVRNAGTPQEESTDSAETPDVVDEPEAVDVVDEPETPVDVLPEIGDTPDDSLVEEFAPEAIDSKVEADNALEFLRGILAENAPDPEEVHDSVRNSQDALNKYADNLDVGLDDAEDGSDKESFLEGEKFRVESASDALEDVLPPLDDAADADADEPIAEDTITQAINDLRNLNNPLATAQADIFDAMRENGMPVTVQQVELMREMLGGVVDVPEATDDDRAIATVTDRVLEAIAGTTPDDVFNPADEYREAIQNAAGNDNMREQIRNEIEADNTLTDVERRELLGLLDDAPAPAEDVDVPEADAPESEEVPDNFGVDDFNAWRDVISNFDADAGDSVDELRGEISEDPYITDEQREELIRELNERAGGAVEPEPEPAPEAADEAQNNDLENAFDEMMGAFDEVAEDTDADLYNDYIDNGINENNQDQFIDAAKRLLGNDHPAVVRVEELLGRRNEEEAPEAADEPAPAPAEEPLADWERELLDDIPDAEAPAPGVGQYNPLTPAQRSAVENAIDLATRRAHPRAAEILTEALERHNNGEILDYELNAALGNAVYMIKPYARRGDFTAEDMAILANISEVQASIQRNMSRADNDPSLPELSWNNLEAQMERNEGLLDPIDDTEINEWLERIQTMTVTGEEKRFERLPQVAEANALIIEASEAFDSGDRERAQELLRQAVTAFDAAIDVRRGVNMNDAFKRSLERRRRATEALSARMDQRAPRIAQGGRTYYTSGQYNRNLDEVIVVGGRGAGNTEVREARVGDTIIRTHGDNKGQQGVIVGFKGERGIEGQTPLVEVMIYDTDPLGRRGGAGYRILPVSMNTVKKLDGSITDSNFTDMEIDEFVDVVERSGKTLGRNLKEEVAAAARRNRDLGNDNSAPAPAPTPEPITPESIRDRETNTSAFDSPEGEPVSGVSDEQIQKWIGAGWGDRIDDMKHAAENLPSAAALVDPNLSRAEQAKAALDIVGFDTGRTFGPAGYRLEDGKADISSVFKRYNGSTEWRVSGTIKDADGKALGLLTRNIEVHTDADGVVKIHIHNSFMQINKRTNRGAGFAQALNGQMEAWAAANHTATDVGPIFSIEASLENGGYVWSKFGFRFDGERYARSYINDLKNLAQPGSIEADQVNELVKAADRGENILPVDIMMVGFQRGMSDKNGDNWLGKKVLNGSSWHGIKDISPRTNESVARRNADVERKEAAPSFDQLQNPLFQIGEQDDNAIEFVVNGLQNLNSNRGEAKKYRPREWAAINNLLMNGGNVAALPAELRSRVHADIKELLKQTPQGAGPVLYDINRAFFKQKYSDRPAPSSLGEGEVLKNLRVMTPNEARDSGLPPERMMDMRSRNLGRYVLELPEGFTYKQTAGAGINGSTNMVTHTESGRKFLFKMDDYRRGEPLDGLENNANLEQGVNNILRAAGFVGVNYVAPFEGKTPTGADLPIIVQAMAGEHLGLDGPATNYMFARRNAEVELEDPTQYVDLLMFDMASGHSDRHDGNSMIGKVDGEVILLPIDNTLLRITDEHTKYTNPDRILDWMNNEMSRSVHMAAANMMRRMGKAGFKNMMLRSLREYAQAIDAPDSNYAAPEFTRVFRESLGMIEENLDMFIDNIN